MTITQFDVQRSIPAIYHVIFRLEDSRTGTTDMEPSRLRNPVIAVELALLLLLATLWGASYTFIKLGVATNPPVTLIAARTSIAGVLLLVIMRWARNAKRCHDMEALPVSGLPQQRDPMDTDCMGRTLRGCGADKLSSTRRLRRSSHSF
jgi:EamA-like transporter family